MESWRDVAWLLWLAAALVGGLIEVVSLQFVASMFVVGALAASVAALAGANATAQVAVFAVTSAVLLVVARPPLRRWAERTTPLAITNAAALIGRDATVMEIVTEHGGQVKLAGEVWSARAAPGEYPLEIGSHVSVVRIDGATAVVTAAGGAPRTRDTHGGELGGDPT